MRFKTLMFSLAIVFLVTCAANGYGQEAAPPVADPIEQLRLTPEQRQRIRLIFEENKQERQLTNRRLREANAALDLALDAEPYDENLIEQRLTELAAAQTAQMRMRIQTELRIRRELGPEQLAMWRRLRLQLRDFAGAQRPLNQRPANQTLRPNRRNGVAPLPRRSTTQP